MKRFKAGLIATCCAALLFGFTWTAFAAGGSAEDPVLSLSYIEDVFSPSIIADAGERTAARFDSASKTVADYGEHVLAKISDQTALDTAVQIAVEELQARGEYFYSAPQGKVITLEQGQVIAGLCGTQVMLRSGSGVVFGNPVINITAGYDAVVGSNALQNTRYLFPENDGSGVRITSDSAQILVTGAYKVLDAVRAPRYTDLADALSKMGLVQGAANGYELHRGATRAEAVTMLIRLLAEEKAALSGTYSHPFTDVDAWAQQYVGYAYEKKYALGVSNNRFGSSTLVTANQYMTFLLRALGYDDKAGDFAWDDAVYAAARLGVLTETEATMIASTPFSRDQMMYLSYYSLFAKCKGDDATLLDRLIASGAVDGKTATSACAGVTRTRP